MFEGAKLIAIGALEDFPNGSLGYRLRLPDDRLITVTGLTVNECWEIASLFKECKECQEIASLFGEFVVFGLTAK